MTSQFLLQCNKPSKTYPKLCSDDRRLATCTLSLSLGTLAVDSSFRGGFAVFHEFIIPIPTDALFDPVNVMGDYY